MQHIYPFIIHIYSYLNYTIYPIKRILCKKLEDSIPHSKINFIDHTAGRYIILTRIIQYF